ncbi:hypothetical protein [uncultured Novosphingobium sp.]|uniref:hypothetical protein n=1 Tax=uncultured Novosphingobium sp. TaxID=292277 RepID=UPI00258EC670|nr:hypothetical protein [uncultured Novosphingobium sp.]
MSAITVEFNGRPLVVQIGENTDLALRAAAQAKLLVGTSQRSGTLAEREAIPLADRKRGLRFLVTIDGDGNPIWRVFEWRLAGDASGPIGTGTPRTSAGWEGLYTEAERKNLGIGFFGELPIANQQGMQEARNDIDKLYAVSIADFKATALSAEDDPDVELSWSLYGIRPDKLMVSVGSYSATVDGGATKLRLPRWSDTNTLAVIGNSLSDPTDDPNKWPRVLKSRRGSDLVASARYSSDIRQLPRIGLTPLLLTVQGGTIPASGTANVTAVNGIATNDPGFLSYPESFLSTGDSSLTTGVTLDGVVISGGKSYAARASVVNAGSSAYKIAQIGGTAPLVLTGPALFVPGLKYEMDRPDVAFVVWLGNNIFYSGVPNFYGDHTNPGLWDILDQLDAYIGGRQGLFLPVIPDAGWPAEGSPAGPIGGVEYGNHQTSAMNAANARTRTRYPHRHALAAGKTLLQSLQALAAGPGAADDVAAGLTPRNIRADSLHLNDLGNLGVANHIEPALAALTRPPVITDETVFSIVPVWTRPADYTIFPIREPETFTGEAVTAGLVRGFEAELGARQDAVETAISGALTSSAYFPTLAEAIDVMDVGAYFNSHDSGAEGPHAGVRWIYKVSANAPFYEAVQQWSTKEDSGLGNVDNTSDAQKVSEGPIAQALGAKVAEDVFNGTVAEIASDLVAQQSALDGKAETVTVNVRRFAISAAPAAVLPDSVTAIVLVDRANALFVPASAPEVLEPTQQNYSWFYTNGTSKRWKLAEQQIGFEVFGAVGNGTADDAIPMQRCIDYVLSRAIPIDVTGGKNFRTTKSLNCTNNINTNPLVMRGASGRLTSLITGDLTEAYPVLDFTNAKRGGMRHIAVRTTATSLDTCSLLLAETDPSGINNFSLLFCSIYNSSLNAKASIIGLTADQVQLIYCEVIADGPSCQSAYRNDNNNLYGVSSKFRTIAAYSSDLTLVTATSTGFICQRGPGLDIRGFSSVTGIDCYLGCTGAVGSSTGMARFEGGGRKMQVRLLGCRSEDNTSAGATPCDCIYVVDAIYNSEITGTYGPKGGMFAGPGTNYYGRFSGSAGGTGFFNQAGPQIGIDVSLGDGANSLGALSPAGLAGSKDWKLRGRIGTRSAVLAGFATIPGLIIEGLSSEDTVINQTRSSPTHSRMHALEASTPTNLRPAWNGPNNQISFPAYTGGSGQKAMGFIDVPLATLAHSGAATDVAYPTVVTTIHGILKSTSAANNSIVMQTGLNGGSGDRLTLLIPSAGAYEFEARVEMIRTGAGSVNALFSIQASPAHSADGVVSTGGQVLRVARRLSNAGVGSFVSSDSMRVGFAINNGASDPVESAYAKYQSS